MHTKQALREYLTVSNDDIAERIIGMSFSQKREAWADWDAQQRTFRTRSDFHEWLFDRTEQKILAEIDNHNQSSFEGFE